MSHGVDVKEEFPPPKKKKRAKSTNLNDNKCPKTVIKQASMYRTIDRIKQRIRQMDPNSYCMVLLAQMRNGKLQVASNYPEVGSSFVTSELALRFSNCTAELDVFKTDECAVHDTLTKPIIYKKVTTEMALQLVEKNRIQLSNAQKKLDDSLALLQQSLAGESLAGESLAGV